MIVYDLCCGAGHGFEGWFRSAEEFESQRASAMVECPFCSDTQVTRRPSASRVNLVAGRGEREVSERRLDGAAHPLIEQLRHFVKEHVEDVGRDFAEEARKMHFGDSEVRSIHGLATRQEVSDLHEEGIEAAPLPLALVDKQKLN